MFFPEYKDDSNKTTNHILETDILPNSSKVFDWINKLIGFIDFFSDEECNLLIDSMNAEACNYLFKTLPEEYPSYAQRFRGLMKNKEDVRKYPSVLNDASILGAIHISDIKAKSIDILSNKIQAIPLDLKNAFDWLCKNRHPKRIVVLNPKHGDENTGGHRFNDGKPVSQFTGNKDDADELLQKAIGVPEWGRLFAYDAQNDCYVDFMSNDKKVDLSKTERPYHIFPIDIATMMNIKNITRIRKKLALVGQGNYSPKR